jgi:hypothetical protein
VPTAFLGLFVENLNMTCAGRSLMTFNSAFKSYDSLARVHLCFSRSFAAIATWRMEAHRPSSNGGRDQRGAQMLPFEGVADSCLPATMLPTRNPRGTPCRHCP